MRVWGGGGLRGSRRGKEGVVKTSQGLLDRPHLNKVASCLWSVTQMLEQVDTASVCVCVCVCVQLVDTVPSVRAGFHFQPS